MKINVFGVGRSGTKAVLLYLAYLIAKNEKTVKINYEPYFWKSIGILSHVGMKINLDTKPVLFTDEKLSPRHEEFIRNLIKEERDVSIVTKFIRGNGRIGQINDIIKPDYTFVIIREVYDVLNSLTKFDWDFFTTPISKRENSWKYFFENIQYDLLSIDSSVRTDVEKNNCWEVQNAFYWYVMNVAALKYEHGNTYYIPYKEIEYIDKLTKKLSKLEMHNVTITDKKFTGENVQKDFPLRHTKGIPRGGYYLNLLNHLRFSLTPNSNLSEASYGDWLEIATVDPGNTKKKKKNRRTVKKVQNHALINYFQHDIHSRSKIKIQPIVLPDYHNV